MTDKEINVEDFKAWLLTHEPDATFDANDSHDCALCQYALDKGWPLESVTFNEIRLFYSESVASYKIHIPASISKAIRKRSLNKDGFYYQHSIGETGKDGFYYNGSENTTGMTFHELASMI